MAVKRDPENWSGRAERLLSVKRWEQKPLEVTSFARSRKSLGRKALASSTWMPTRRSAFESSATKALTPGGVTALVVLWFPGSFVITISGIVVLVAMVKGHPGAWFFAPGLFLIGVGLGVMLTPSVNVVQSAFPENLQGEISGLSRSVSNLGSTLGVAIGGTILVSGLADPKRSYGIAMVVLAFIGLIGLGATILLRVVGPHQCPTFLLTPERGTGTR